MCLISPSAILAKSSFMIGDQKTDMEFAKKAKIKGYLFNEKNLFKFIKKRLFKK